MFMLKQADIGLPKIKRYGVDAKTDETIPEKGRFRRSTINPLNRHCEHRMLLGQRLPFG